MYSLILLNGGIGARVGASSPKQFLRVHGMPIVVYSLVAADAVPEIGEIVVNFPDGFREMTEEIVQDFAVRTPVRFVEAGPTRHDSVSLMIEACTNDRIIIHESARPMVTSADFQRLIEAEQDNVSYMAPIPFTVAPVDPRTRRVTGHLDRDFLRNVQLPQKFNRRDLEAAHAYAAERGLRFTEDATLCSVSGHEVFFLDGDDRNVKVTGPTDVTFANYMLSVDREDGMFDV